MAVKVDTSTSASRRKKKIGYGGGAIITVM